MEDPCNSPCGKYGAELLEASTRLLRQLSRAKVVESMLDFMEKFGQSPHLSFDLFGPEGAKLVAGRGLHEKLVGRIREVDREEFGEILRNGQTWIDKDFRNRRTYSQPLPSDMIFVQAHERVQATITLPFRKEEKVIGALGLDYEEAGQSPDSGRLWLLEQYAVWAGVAYENAGIFEEQQQAMANREQLEEEIRHMAYHDALTGLPNRRLLEDRLNLAISQAKRFDEIIAVLFLDLDSMKQINDSYGHEAGDHLLEAVASRLRSSVRDIDTVARISGDEFVLVLPRQENRTMTSELADRILAAIRLPFDLGIPEAVSITASIGIGFFPEDGTDYATLLRSADKAMYLAKQQGRDQWIFAPGNAAKK